MKNFIIKFQDYLNNHKKIKEYYWFLILWCLGFLTLALISYAIKLIIL